MAFRIEFDPQVLTLSPERLHTLTSELTQRLTTAHEGQQSIPLHDGKFLATRVAGDNGGPPLWRVSLVVIPSAARDNLGTAVALWLEMTPPAEELAIVVGVITDLLLARKRREVRS